MAGSQPRPDPRRLEAELAGRRGTPRSASSPADPRRLEVEMARPWRRMLPLTNAIWMARPPGSPPLAEVCQRASAWAQSLRDVHHRVRSVEGSDVLYLSQTAAARLPELVAAFWNPPASAPEVTRAPSGRPKVSLVGLMLDRLGDVQAPRASLLAHLKSGLVDRADLQPWEGILFETVSHRRAVDVLTALDEHHPYFSRLKAWLRAAVADGRDDPGPGPRFPLPHVEEADAPTGLGDLVPEEALAAFRLGRAALCCPTLERHTGPLLERLQHSTAVARLAQRVHPERIHYYRSLLLRLRGASTSPCTRTTATVMVEYRELARCLGFHWLRERPEDPALLGPACSRTLALLAQILLHHAHPTLSPESWWIRGSPMRFRLDRPSPAPWWGPGRAPSPGGHPRGHAAGGHGPRGRVTGAGGPTGGTAYLVLGTHGPLRLSVLLPPPLSACCAFTRACLVPNHDRTHSGCQHFVRFHLMLSLTIQAHHSELTLLYCADW